MQGQQGVLRLRSLLLRMAALCAHAPLLSALHPMQVRGRGLLNAIVIDPQAKVQWSCLCTTVLRSR